MDIKLIWENKKDNLSIWEDLERYHPDFFKSFEHHSSNSNIDYETIKNSKFWKNKLFWGDNLEVLLFFIK